MRQTIIWTNAEPIHWCIYVALGGDELIFQIPAHHAVEYTTYCL